MALEASKYSILASTFKAIPSPDHNLTAQELEKTLEEVAYLLPQPAYEAPKNPRIGLIRLALAPWQPVGAGTFWVWWNGTTWLSV